MSLRDKFKFWHWFPAFVVFTFCVSNNTIAQTYSGTSNSLEIRVTDPELMEKSAKPVIRWVYPSESVKKIAKDIVNLKIGISSKSPVVKVTMVVNNEVVEVFENFKTSETGYLFDAWLEKSVNLNIGPNDIQLMVQNEQGALKHQRKIEVEMTPSSGSNHALIFGIDDYDSWDDLNGPVHDADKIARVLEEKGFTLEIVRNSTTFDLLGKLEDYVTREFKANDQLFIYFAGHGHFDSTSGEGYFVCRNSVKQSNANSTYISYEAIKSIVNNIPVQHIFMLMDAVKGDGEPLSVLFDQLAEQPESLEFTSELDARTRLAILSGSSSYEPGITSKPGSPLSNALISYLKKVEQTDGSSWRDLLNEFEGVEPDPIYVEFGDHNSNRGFSFKKYQTDN